MSQKKKKAFFKKSSAPISTRVANKINLLSFTIRMSLFVCFFSPVIAACSYLEIFILLVPVTLVHTGPIFECIDEARDVI